VRVNFRAALVFGQIPLVMRLEKCLYVSLIRADRMNKGLEDRDAIFRTVSVLAQRRACQPVGGPIGQVKPAIGPDAFVLRIGQMRTRRSYHAVELGSSPGLAFKLIDPDEVVELRYAHGSISFSAPKMKSFGSAATLLMKEPWAEALRRHSSEERKIGLTLRRNTLSAFCRAV
jgi:hypothetical protein